MIQAHAIAVVKLTTEPRTLPRMPNQPRIDLTTLPHKTPWAWLVATFFGAGLLRPGPGTYGSAGAVLLWYAAAHAFEPSRIHLALATALAAVIATAIGIPAATIVARESLSEDPGHVVIDEVAGQLIALIISHPDLPHALFSLLLFRLFDILKPPPIRQLERLPTGTGIMLDDIAAGLLALIAGFLLSLGYHAVVR